ncbi:MAG TPA: hypothetical protein VFK05_02635 [Polyangiaceae bacterium]|nr:hypothetical protein [Polyangiaceae bacterium]
MTTGMPVDRCLPSDCCVLRRTSPNDRGADCFCVMNSEFLHPDELPPCEDWAGETGVVVDQCPPPGEPRTNVTQCAAAGEGCTVAELEQSKELGCCEGNVCKRDDQGRAVCTEASDAERALSSKCEHVARNSTGVSDQPKLLNTELKTSVGTIELSPYPIAFSRVSDLGCLVTTEFHLDNGQCQFGFDAEVRDGKLAIRLISADLADCPGFEGDPSDDQAGHIADSHPPATLSFEGFSCGSNQYHHNECVAGTWDLHLDGEFLPTTRLAPEDPRPSTVRISDQHLRFEGVSCGSYGSPAECPAP